MNRYPENRQGTKSNRMLQWSYYCNVIGGRTLVRATHRQWATALRNIEAGYAPHDVQGRIIRACMRDMVRNGVGETIPL